jgi:hypothetical protein
MKSMKCVALYFRSDFHGILTPGTNGVKIQTFDLPVKLYWAIIKGCGKHS